MKRTTMFLDDQAESDLQALAQQQKRPVAALVREAIQQYIVGQRSGPAAKLGFLAIGRSGRKDIADRHETRLWSDPHKDPKPGGARRTGRRSQSR